MEKPKSIYKENARDFGMKAPYSSSPRAVAVELRTYGGPPLKTSVFSNLLERFGYDCVHDIEYQADDIDKNKKVSEFVCQSRPGVEYELQSSSLGGVMRGR